MKRIMFAVLAVMLCLAMLFVLAACGTKKESEAPAPSAEPVEEVIGEAAEEAEEPAEEEYYNEEKENESSGEVIPEETEKDEENEKETEVYNEPEEDEENGETVEEEGSADSEEDEENGETENKERKVSFTYSWDDEKPSIGSIVHMKATVTGYEDVDYLLQWQYSDNPETSGWTDYPGANDETFDLQITEENNNYFWRVSVFLK